MCVYTTLTDSQHEFSNAELMELWDMLGDIPISGDEDEIEERFLWFPAGTPREEVWHWFDDWYPGGLMKMLDDRHKQMMRRFGFRFECV